MIPHFIRAQLLFLRLQTVNISCFPFSQIFMLSNLKFFFFFFLYSYITTLYILWASLYMLHVCAFCFRNCPRVQLSTVSCFFTLQHFPGPWCGHVSMFASCHDPLSNFSILTVLFPRFRQLRFFSIFFTHHIPAHTVLIPLKRPGALHITKGVGWGGGRRELFGV